jgi:hypothetical protein
VDLSLVEHRSDSLPPREGNHQITYQRSEDRWRSSAPESYQFTSFACGYGRSWAINRPSHILNQDTSDTPRQLASVVLFHSHCLSLSCVFLSRSSVGACSSQKREAKYCYKKELACAILSEDFVLCSSTIELSSCDSRGSTLLQHHRYKRSLVYHPGNKPEQMEEGVKIYSKPSWLTRTWM